MNTQAIYYIENVANNKVYIGSALDIYNRWSVHLSALQNNKHPNRYLQFAWNKYGKENFIFGIIECISDKTKLIEREQYWINKMFANEMHFGYNLRKNAQSNLGMIVSAETRKKLSEASKRNKNRPPSPLGKKHSEIARKNMSLSKKGIPKSIEHRKKIALALTGKRKPDFILCKSPLVIQ